MSLTLNLHEPPLVATGNGQLAALTQARDRQLTFDLAGRGHELKFTLPGRHWSNTLIKKGQTDVVAYWGDSAIPLMRYRIVSRSVSSEEGQVTCSYVAVSYKSLVEAWLFHDGDQRSWTATAQSLIAWQIFSAGQAKTRGNLGVVRGNIPTVDTARDRLGSATSGRPPEFYDAGQDRFSAIQELSEVDGGFEWDIVPHPTTANALTFDVWTPRGTATDRLELVDGSTVSAWTMDDGMADYANVTRTQGREPPAENEVAAPGVVAYRPVSKNPTDVSSGLGRWEESFTSEGILSAAVTLDADANLARTLDDVPGWTLRLRRGAWEGPSRLWLGDDTLLNVQVMADDPASEAEERIVDFFDTVRVLGVDLAVDEEGNEDVSIRVGKPVKRYVDFRRDLKQRFKKLERRR